MNYCPNCGKILVESFKDNQNIKTCTCGYIDFNNWVFVSCVVCAFNEKNEFLMVRLKGKEEGKITFPGGFRNLGESLEDAAKREFNEETGYEIDTPHLFKAYTRDDLRLVFMAYTAHIVGGEFKENSETSEVIFYSKQNPPLFHELRGNLTTEVVLEMIN